MTNEDMLRDIPAGQPFKGPSNLTEFEKAHLEVDSSNPAVAAEAARRKEQLDQQSIERVRQIAATTSVEIPEPRSIDELPRERVQEILEFIAKVGNMDIPSKDPVTEVDPTSIFAPQVVAPEDIELPQNIPAPAITPEPEPQENPVAICPNCAWDLSVDPTVPEREDKVAWTRSILGDARFTKDYDLFGDRVRVTFRSRTMAEQEKIHEQLRKDSETNMFDPLNPGLYQHQYYDRMRKLSMAASVKFITGFDTDQSPMDSYEISAGEFYSMLVKDWHESLFNSIYRQFLIFEDLCFKLKEAANSPDFWDQIV